MNENRITYFAYTDSRNKKVPFGIKAKDRTRHVYVIGKTGMGKSTLLENMAVQDIKNGEGFAFIDPHGKTAELLLEYIPEHRVKDVVYFAPFDTEFPICFNVLESVDADKRHLVVSGLMSTFKKIWQDAWSARMEYILTNTLLALLEYPNATLLGVNRMLSDKEFRKRVVENVTDPSVKSFWVDEFANYTERMAAEAVPAIQNKIGQFTANALIRNMIGQPKSSFNIREIMDQGKIIIINLSKGRIGESNANLLGGMLITKIYLGAMSRADIPERVLKGLPNFYLFVDEFQNFANESFADILSEARKYKLNLTIAHQYIEQMEEEVRAAVFGNVGTMVSFRVGAYDAEVLEKEFAPQFTMEDIVNLGFAQIYLKLMIDGISSPPFSAETMGPIKPLEVSLREKVIATSRAQFARTRADVEAEIAEWHKPIESSTTSKAKKSFSNDSRDKDTRPSSQVPAQPPRPATVPPSVPPKAPPKITEAPVVSVVPQVPVSKPVIPAQPRREEPPRPPRPVKPVPEFDSTEQVDGFATLGSLLQKVQQKPVVAPVIVSVPKPQTPKPQDTVIPRPQGSQLVKKVINDQKAPTPKNMNELRSALSSLVKPPTPPVAPTQSVPPRTPESTPPTNSKQNSPLTVEKKPHEVPEEILNNLLKID